MRNKKQEEYLININKKLIDFINKKIGSSKECIMSQRELSKQLECSNASVSRWLSGERILPLDMAIKMCDFLNLDKNEFFGDALIFDERVSEITFNKSDFRKKYDKLSEDNKLKVIEYIDFLLFQEKKNSKVKNKNII